ncbi:MAG: membrane integrity-associated transporter subunit PqiC, partial [Rhodobacterales bacterium]|nr:membrane integrity-associated transporter subunit PqiC [Rhodobacterales bacterium]
MRSPMRALAFIAVLGGVLGLGACAQDPAPEDAYYRLRAAAPARVLATPYLPGTLEVEKFVADGLTAGRPISYSEAGMPHQVKEYHYHFWTQPPTIMVRDEMVAFLRAAKVAKAVVTPEMRVGADYELTGRILRLEKINGAQPRAALDLELAVTEIATQRLLFLNTYHQEVAAGGDTVAAAVAALDDGLNATFTRFLADLTGQ